MFKGLIARRLYKSFGVKGLIGKDTHCYHISTAETGVPVVHEGYTVNNRACEALILEQDAETCSAVSSKHSDVIVCRSCPVWQ
jgi:hypothetical protein